MPSMTPDDLNTPWSIWKRNWAEQLSIATLAAFLETGAFLLYLYLFMQDAHRLLTVMGWSLVALWIFNVGASALHAYVLGHPKMAAQAAFIAIKDRLASLSLSLPSV